MNKRKLPDSVFAVAAVLLWSTAFVGIKFGYQSGVKPFFFAGIRFFLSGLILWPLALYMNREINAWKNLKDNIGFIFLIGILQIFILYAALYTGVFLVPASITAIVIGIQPLITSAGAHFFTENEKIVPRQWFALLLAVAGLVILSVSRNSAVNRSAAGSSGELTGIILLIFSMLTGSASSILVSVSKRRLSPLVLSSGQFTIGGLLLLLLSLITDGFPEFYPDRSFALSLVWLVFVSSSAISLWFWLLSTRKAKVGALSVWKFIIPVLGAVLGWVLFKDDTPDAGSAAGMIIIGVSLIIYFRPEKKRGN